MYTKRTIFWVGHLGANCTVLLHTLLLQLYKSNLLKTQPNLSLYVYTHYKLYFYRSFSIPFILMWVNLYFLYIKGYSKDLV